MLPPLEDQGEHVMIIQVSNKGNYFVGEMYTKMKHNEGPEDQQIWKKTWKL